MSASFANKVVVVTGGNSGIGLASAQVASDEASYITGVELNIDGGFGQL
jgi:NAD(P)-dependent dehydrogenase (short-subunit alcohol dehydrogenase family)